MVAKAIMRYTEEKKKEEERERLLQEQQQQENELVKEVEAIEDNIEKAIEIEILREIVEEENQRLRQKEKENQKLRQRERGRRLQQRRR